MASPVPERLWTNKDAATGEERVTWEPLADTAAYFGANIRALAEHLGLSMEELAAEAGISARTLYNHLSMTTYPNLVTIVVLAETIGVEPFELIRRTPRNYRWRPKGRPRGERRR